MTHKAEESCGRCKWDIRQKARLRHRPRGNILHLDWLFHTISSLVYKRNRQVEYRGIERPTINASWS